jgi:DNA-binding NtrC family response regulator
MGPSLGPGGAPDVSPAPKSPEGTIAPPPAATDEEQSAISQSRQFSVWRPFRIPEIGFSLEDHERELLRQALIRTKYNKSAAAKLLGLSRATLRYRLEKFGISDKPEDESDEKAQEEVGSTSGE